MKKTVPAILLCIVMIATSASTMISSFNWKVKEETYNVSFKGDDIEGKFSGLKANIVFDETSLGNSKISATIDANSISTGNWLRNRHAKSALGADLYPNIRFESISIAKKGASYEAVGKLTLKDITRTVVLPFTVSANGQEAVFEGKFSIATKDFNVSRMGTPEVVEINLKVPATK